MSYAKPVPPKPADSNGAAVTGFVLSLLGLLVFPPLILVGLIFCWVGMKKQPNGLAVAGMVISLVGFIIWVIVGVLMVTMVAAPVMCCLGMGTAAYNEMGREIERKYENHSVVVEQLGGIDSVDIDLSGNTEYYEPGTNTMVYEVSGPRGEGVIVVRTDYRGGDTTTIVTLYTDDGEWELERTTGMDGFDSIMEIDETPQ